MTYDQYESQLTQALEREKAAKQQIAGEQSGIESLKGQIADLEQKIAAVQTEKYSILRITEADVTSAQSEITSIAQALDGLEALSPEDLLKRKNDIGAAQARIDALTRKPVTLLWKIRDRMGPLMDRLERTKARLNRQPPPAPVAEVSTSYTVKLVPGNRESLSRIASYDFIYGSAVRWPTLYRSNRSIIDKKYDRYVKHTGDPKYSRAADLIYPGQVLDIPR
jgi:nucleoid-associated protein YgaU